MMDEMWDEMEYMHRKMDKLMNTFWGPTMALPTTQLQQYTTASTDVKETNKEIVATFDIPGVDKKDIELHVDEKHISVKAEKKSEKENKEGFYRHERSYQGFYRQFQLPKNVIPEQARAEYKEGVLIVTMPKASPIESKKGKKLEIE